MTDQIDSAKPPDPLDGLVTQLLSCGAVLSQMITEMVEFGASGRAAPDAAPIPEVAHSLIRGVLHNVEKRHSKRDINVAAAIVGETIDAICEEIYVVDPDWIDELNGAVSGEGGGAS
jgi:hypothetical protein